MIKIKMLIFIILSRVINFSFKNFFNMTISLGLLAFIISQILTIIKADISGYWKLIFPMIVILSLSVRRVSNNLIFSKLTKHASMIIKDTSKYQNIDYMDNKDEISNLLKEEFIEGLVKISHSCNKVRFSTHKWFVENVVLTEKVKEIYNISIVESGKTSLALEILTLINRDKAIKLDSNIIDSIFRKRKSYKVKLIKKQNKCFCFLYL